MATKKPFKANAFNYYAHPNDYDYVLVGPVRYVARLVYDEGTKPNDFDCYTTEAIRAWEAGDWYFGGIVIDAYVDQSLIVRSAASLWGIEVNYGRRKTRNEHLARTANDLIEEAEPIVRAAIESIVQAWKEQGAAA